MILTSNVKAGAGEPNVRVLLYPDYTISQKALYDSDEVTFAQPTIAEELEELGDLDDLIEDDFLELQCEVVIEFEEEEAAFEEEIK